MARVVAVIPDRGHNRRLRRRTLPDPNGRRREVGLVIDLRLRESCGEIWSTSTKIENVSASIY